MTFRGETLTYCTTRVRPCNTASTTKLTGYEVEMAMVGGEEEPRSGTIFDRTVVSDDAGHLFQDIKLLVNRYSRLL